MLASAAESSSSHLEVLGLPTISCSEFQKDIIQDVPTNVKQELMIALCFPYFPVDHEKVREAWKAASQVVKVVAQPPPKLQTSECSSSLAAMSESKSVIQQTSSSVIPPKKEG